jgi:hypothetical protein
MGDEPATESKLKFEKYKFNWSLVKWAVGFFVFVCVTNTVSNDIKDRNEGIEEMKAFDRYVDIIHKADNTDDRWKLAVFFSAVTPTKRLRDGWVAYKDSIREEYDTFIVYKKQQSALQSKVVQGKDPSALAKLNQVTNQLIPYEKKLAGPAQTTANAQGEVPLNNFIDQLRKDTRNKVLSVYDDFFKSANTVNNSVVLDLLKDLGDSYTTIQTSYNTDYKSATFSNQYGIESRFDNTKKIWPVFQAKLSAPEAIFTLSENGKTETFKTSIQNIDWDGVRQFIRKYYIDRLSQLK